MESKQPLLALAIALLTCTTHQANAKVWRVNNVPGITADFTTPQLAHNNSDVNEGDTLHIEPSTVRYGNLILSKRLTIISVGDFLSDNPGVQFSSITGYLNGVSVNAGAAGAVFHCNMENVDVNTGANNCRFERCRFNGNLRIAGANNIFILQSYIDGRIGLTFTNNNVFSNNIIQDFISMANDASAFISNNILNAANNSGSNSIQNSTFQNNIINKNGVYTFTNSIVKYNLSSNTTLPAADGNVNNVNMANVFVNASGTNDTSFVLKPGSVAIGAGESGANAGAYGGTSPFKPGLQAAIPAIYQLTVPSTPNGNTINIIFSTKSNN